MSVSQARPPNMPPYPKEFKSIEDLDNFLAMERKRTLIIDLLWMEKSLIGGDFSHYSSIIKSKMELKKINETLFPEK